MIITKNYVFPLEIKFSTKNNLKSLPKWNSNIPKSNCIYIYSIASAEIQPLIFLGNDYISNDISLLINSHFKNFNEKEKLQELAEEINNLDENKKYNPFGLFPKIRTDFLTKKEFEFGNKEHLNIFEFSIKNNWDKNVIDILLGLVENEKQ